MLLSLETISFLTHWTGECFVSVGSSETFKRAPFGVSAIGLMLPKR
jgi:hypothetical protein